MREVMLDLFKNIIFYSTKGHEHCDICDEVLYAARWGKGWLWLCLKCLTVKYEE